MAEGPLKYDFGMIGVAHADIMGAKGKLDQTEGDVTALMGRLKGTWTEGNAALAWSGYQSEWNKIQDDVKMALNALGLAVNQALENSQGAENSNASMWPS